MSFYRRLSADIKMKNFKIKTSFLSLEGLKAQAKKTGINFMIFILIFAENCLKFDALHDFSVWLTIDFNPADSNRFQSHTGKYIILCYY